jgi:integrase
MIVSLLSASPHVVLLPKGLTVTEFLQHWLEGSVWHTAYRDYDGHVKNHIVPELGRLKLAKLTATHVQALYRNKLDSGLAPRTVQYIHATLHKALDQAVKWRLMTYNVSDVVTEPPQKRSERDALTLRQVWNFLEVAKGNVLRIHIVLTGQPTAPVL